MTAVGRESAGREAVGREAVGREAVGREAVGREAVGGEATDAQVNREQAANPIAADLVVINGKIWTGVAGGAEVQALAVVGDKIVAVGDNQAIRRRIGPLTKIIDAHGRRVVPGLTDSHTHIISGGLHLKRLNLRDVKDKQAFIVAVGRDAQTKKKWQWVVGGRWSVESWVKPESPTRFWIDAVTGNVPVLLRRMDGHQALVNTATLRLAGVDKKGPPDPVGGEIERDHATGEPTGILKGSAMELVTRLIPPPSQDEMYQALLRAQKHLNSLGITGVHDMCEPAHLAIFERVLQEHKLTVRIYTFVSVVDWDTWGKRVAQYPNRDPLLHVAGLKGYMDGSLGSRTAYMREPYSDAGEHTKYPRGQLTDFADPPESLYDTVKKADGLGLQLAVHAIGDEANHLILNAYEQARKANGRTDARHRIEHAQHLLLEDVPRFAALGVVASMQPYHKADDGRYAEKRLGRERLRGSYAYRQLVDSGASVTFGSDWPVVTADPFAGMDSAVNARTIAGKIWLPQHSLTVEEALRAYTVWPAYASHREKVLGTIEPGMLADFVILSADVLTIPPQQISQVHAQTTVVGGTVVYKELRITNSE